MLRPMFSLCIFLTLFFLAGCAGLGRVPTEHIVMFDKRGDAVDPTGNIMCEKGSELCNGKHLGMLVYRDLKEEEESKYIKDLLEELVNKAPIRDGKRQVLIYTHGGMNTQKGTVARAVDMHEEIFKSGYYPIFINWKSSLVSSYFDHLLFVRQGKDVGWIWGAVTSPFYLVADAARAVSRAPIVWGAQLISQAKTFRGVILRSEKDVNKRSELLEKQYLGTLNQQTKDHSGAIAIEAGTDQRDKWDMFFSGFSGVVLFPVRMFVSAPLIDGFGVSSWDNMTRRTRLLFRTESEFHSSSSWKERGGLSRFMRALEKAIEDSGEKWEITVVGHSMGTIVLNEVIRRYPDLNYTDIIYMAAACSIRDFENSVIPYLVEHEETQFYNLTLHRKAEERERFEWSRLPYVDPAIRGSLLSWIDLFLAKPLTPMDRALGKYDNFVRAEHIFQNEVRGRIHLKEFSVGNELKFKEPQKHGEFDEAGEGFQYKFWKPGFYEPEPHR